MICACSLVAVVADTPSLSLTLSVTLTLTLILSFFDSPLLLHLSHTRKHTQMLIRSHLNHSHRAYCPLHYSIAPPLGHK